MQHLWSEWDGRGHEDAAAWAMGWVIDLDEAIRDVRRLGIDTRDITILHGWVGTVGEDIIPDACNEDGTLVDNVGARVDEGSIVRATFAFLVVQ